MPTLKKRNVASLKRAFLEAAKTGNETIEVNNEEKNDAEYNDKEDDDDDQNWITDNELSDENDDNEDEDEGSKQSDEDDDNSDDEEWYKTPLIQRIKKIRDTNNEADDNEDDDNEDDDTDEDEEFYKRPLIQKIKKIRDTNNEDDDNEDDEDDEDEGSDEGYNEDFKKPKAKGLILKVSPELQAVIGVKKAGRGEALELTLDYICKNNLQDPEAKEFFIPDEKLSKVFGTDRCRALGLAKFIEVNLSR